MRVNRSVLAILGGLSSLSAVWAQPNSERNESQASAEVVPATAARVRAIAERSDRFRASIRERSRRLARDPAALVEARTVFIGVDLLDRKEEGERSPVYRVRHYRYADDTTITSLVDLQTGRLIEQLETRHLAVPLSSEELAEARALALAERRVAEAVGGESDRLVAEPLVVRTSDPNDPWFGRRVVRLLFRVGRDYVSRPLIYVDLTRREVIVEEGHGQRHGEVQ